MRLMGVWTPLATRWKLDEHKTYGTEYELSKRAAPPWRQVNSPRVFFGCGGIRILESLLDLPLLLGIIDEPTDEAWSRRVASKESA
jgi:hypothetical protein